MQLETARFGLLEFEDSSVIDLPDGIPGFPELTRVVMLESIMAEGFESFDGAEAFWWLQSADDGDLAFFCVMPWAFWPEYELDVETDYLGVENVEDLSVLCIVNTSGEKATANLRAPLLIGVSSRRGRQVILSDDRWPVRSVLGE